jgi:hypothetical protein
MMMMITVSRLSHPIVCGCGTKAHSAGSACRLGLDKDAGIIEDIEDSYGQFPLLEQVLHCSSLRSKFAGSEG